MSISKKVSVRKSTAVSFEFSRRIWTFSLNHNFEENETFLSESTIITRRENNENNLIWVEAGVKAIFERFV